MKHGPVSMNTELIYPGRNRRKTTHEALHQQLSVSLFLVFIEIWRKLTSHRYVGENGRNVKIALFARVGNSLEVTTQKLSKVSFSCSCKINAFPPTDAELHGSLIVLLQGAEIWPNPEKNVYKVTIYTF